MRRFRLRLAALAASAALLLTACAPTASQPDPESGPHLSGPSAAATVLEYFSAIEQGDAGALAQLLSAEVDTSTIAMPATAPASVQITASGASENPRPIDRKFTQVTVTYAVGEHTVTWTPTLRFSERADGWSRWRIDAGLVKVSLPYGVEGSLSGQAGDSGTILAAPGMHEFALAELDNPLLVRTGGGAPVPALLGSDDGSTSTSWADRITRTAIETAGESAEYALSDAAPDALREAVTELVEKCAEWCVESSWSGISTADPDTRTEPADVFTVLSSSAPADFALIDREAPEWSGWWESEVSSSSSRTPVLVAVRPVAIESTRLECAADAAGKTACKVPADAGARIQKPDAVLVFDVTSGSPEYFATVGG